MGLDNCESLQKLKYFGYNFCEIAINLMNLNRSVLRNLREES